MGKAVEEAEREMKTDMCPSDTSKAQGLWGLQG